MSRLFALAALLVLPIVALAHTTVLDSTPKSGSEMAQSPAVIEIQFRDQAKLTSVIAVGADKQERHLEFTPGEKPNTFKVANPQLATGRNEVKWKALSKDGHAIAGTLVFVIKPAQK